MGCDAQTPFLEFWSKQANDVGTGRWKKVRSLQVMPVLPGQHVLRGQPLSGQSPQSCEGWGWGFEAVSDHLGIGLTALSRRGKHLPLWAEGSLL